MYERAQADQVLLTDGKPFEMEAAVMSEVQARLQRYDLVLPVDPEAESAKALAPRPDTLSGKVLGLLDNRKANADHLLLALAEQLQERYELKDIVMLTKPIFSRPAPPEMLEQLAAECDVVLTAIGD